jgi:hypothetical protein
MEIQEAKKKIIYSVNTFQLLIIAQELLYKQFEANESKYKQNDIGRLSELIEENNRICEPYEKYLLMYRDAIKNNNTQNHHYTYLHENLFGINASLIHNTKLIKEIVNKYN